MQRTTSTTLAAVTLAAALGWALYIERADGLEASSLERPQHILPACASDEGDQPGPCVWVGSVDGNGYGRSFRIYRDGRLKHITDARARELRGLAAVTS